MAHQTDCPRLAKCPMYEQLRLAGTVAVWKANYCSGDHARCERFKLAIAGAVVPPNMMPNGSLLRLAP